MRLIIILVLVAFVGFGALHFYRTQSAPAVESVPTENGGSLSGSLSARMGAPVSRYGVTVIVRELLEDSRCPLDVQCIQAGTVRVRADVISGMGTSTMSLTLGGPITTEAEEVTLVSVLPAPYAGVSIKPDEYEFTFEIKKRKLDLIYPL